MYDVSKFYETKILSQAELQPATFTLFSDHPVLLYKSCPDSHQIAAPIN